MEASYSPRRDKQARCMTAARRRNGAKIQKGFKSFETLKTLQNVVKIQE